MISTTPALNKDLLVHDWYLIPESYSAPLIEEALNEYGLEPGQTVLDPFSGAGTTLLAASWMGMNAVGFEVNPFLCFAARVKLAHRLDAEGLSQEASRLLSRLERRLGKREDVPKVAEEPGPWRPQQAALFEDMQMPRLHRWISPAVVQKVLVVKEEIAKVTNPRRRDFFRLALAAILRPCSNMKLTPHAFGSREPKEDAPVLELFADKVNKMVADVEGAREAELAHGKAQVLNVDARYCKDAESDLLPADLAITSPPYLNNLDYTMQTRLELFFLDFVRDMAELRAVRKRMVTCDAKAMYKDVPDSERVEPFHSIQSIAQRLRERHKGKNWGWDYSYMTTQYFGGMHRVLENVLTHLKPGARFVLIVGESAHSGIKVPVPAITGEMGEALGYALEEIRVRRVRRSSSHGFSLEESAVVLRKRSRPGARRPSGSFRTSSTTTWCTPTTCACRKGLANPIPYC